MQKEGGGGECPKGKGVNRTLRPMHGTYPGVVLKENEKKSI